MRRGTRILKNRLFAAVLCAPLCGWTPLLSAQTHAPATVRHAKVLSKQGAVEIEVDIGGGPASFRMVGLAEGAVREAFDRILGRGRPLVMRFAAWQANHPFLRRWPWLE